MNDLNILLFQGLSERAAEEMAPFLLHLRALPGALWQLCLLLGAGTALLREGCVTRHRLD